MNIVKLFGYFYDSKNVYVVLEFCPKGNLWHRLKRMRKFSEDQTKSIIRQMTEVIVYCKQRNVIHRDIKPENILLMDDNCDVIKLSDFGWATHTIDE